MRLFRAGMDAYVIWDLADIKKPVSEKTKIGQKIAKLKQDLVTTGQTSECLIQLHYDQITQKESVSIIPDT